MPIKPIDLQTNISQMIEVGKGEHAKSSAIAEQQHVMEKESSEKSNQIKSKLDEAKKAEKTLISDEEEKNKERKNSYKKNNDNKKNIEEKKKVKDDRMGKIIDVLK